MRHFVHHKNYFSFIIECQIYLQNIKNFYILPTLVHSQFEVELKKGGTLCCQDFNEDKLSYIVIHFAISSNLTKENYNFKLNLSSFSSGILSTTLGILHFGAKVGASYPGRCMGHCFGFLPCTALFSWQLHLALNGGYGEWHIWIPCEELVRLS